METMDSTRLACETLQAMEFAGKRFFNIKETPVLYHYTTIDALYNGILVKEPESEEKALSLFATDHRYLNDEKEIAHGCKILKRYIKKVFKLEFKSNRDIFNPDETISYIISFSKDGDCLPMWSTYGNRGDGIAFGFDSSVLQNCLGRVIPCLYTDNDLESYFLALLKKLESYIPSSPTEIEKKESFFRLGYASAKMVPMLKNKFFSYEREVRFVTMQGSDKRFRLRNSLIVPYTIKYLPKNALKTIVIGPDLQFEKTKMSIHEYIDSLGFENVTIVRSKAPFRNL